MQNIHLLPPAFEGWGRYCFHRCVAVHAKWSTWSLVIGPFPASGPMVSWGYPSARFFPGLWSQVLSQRYPIPRGAAVPVGYPSLRQGEGTAVPGRGVLVTGRGVPQFPAGYPCPGVASLPGLNWGTTGRPGQDKGTPLHSQDRTEVGYAPKTEQQSEYLLPGGGYAFCVHAGGLSC